VKDQVIRMRVLEDLSPIYGVPPIGVACTDPQYGQAEDYPVFIRSLSLLPIELLSFTATPEGNEVQLNWQTSLEQNSAGFDIERSTNGNDYQKIGTVSARGIPSAYRFTDRGVPVGEYYYRLRQTDKDNRFTYSKTVKVTVGNRTTGYRILNNPASSYVDLSLPSKRNATQINLVDVSGRLLSQRTIGAGTTLYRLEGIDQYSPGVYFIQVVSETEKTVLKFIKK
jgi:Secretion system C-terminal sorting domain